jgi:hypothetical protein
VVSRDSQIDHVWNLADKIGACMLVTMSGRGLRARPMHALADREAGCLWFIRDQRGAKDDEIKAAPDALVRLADITLESHGGRVGPAADMGRIVKPTRRATTRLPLCKKDIEGISPRGPDAVPVVAVGCCPQSGSEA